MIFSTTKSGVTGATNHMRVSDDQMPIGLPAVLYVPGDESGVESCGIDILQRLVGIQNKPDT